MLEINFVTSCLNYLIMWPDGDNPSGLTGTRVHAALPRCIEKINVFDELKYVSVTIHQKSLCAGRISINHELSSTSHRSSGSIVILKSKNDKRSLNNLLLFYMILDGYPASPGFPVMHRVHAICTQAIIAIT